MGYGLAYRTIESFAKKFFPDYFAKQIMGELVISRARLSASKMRSKFKNQKDLKINIGCGASNVTGWEGVDVVPSPGVTCVWDCRTSLPFDNESAKGIFSEHFIEHIDFYQEAPLLFKDIYRILKKDAVVRIIVPDAQKYVEAYVKEGWDSIAKVRPLLSNNVDSYSKNTMHTKMELVNWIFRQEYEHKFAYDFESMKYILNQAGFKTVVKQDFNQSLNPELLIDQAARASESLYVEAVKD
jgi:predicted SAM-dependent methyltransferase